MTIIVKTTTYSSSTDATPSEVSSVKIFLQPRDSSARPAFVLFRSFHVSVAFVVHPLSLAGPPVSHLPFGFET